MLMFFNSEEDVCVNKLPELTQQFEEKFKSYKQIKEAKFIREVQSGGEQAALYKVSPPLKNEEGNDHEYVIVSCAKQYIDSWMPQDVWECLIFGCEADATGIQLHDKVIPGGLEGLMDNNNADVAVFTQLGYTITKENP
jgi:hypothetical protein